MKTPFNELVKTLLHQYSILEKKEDEEDEEDEEDNETGGINIDSEDGQGESSR